MLAQRASIFCLLLPLVIPVRGNEPVQLTPFAVNASRREMISGDGRDEVRWISGENIAAATAPDHALRLDPAFSLFRRTDSLGANPTAQGVSLRGIGPSGASRTLVLLDGVPLNDPFGGWVTWMQLPTWALAGAEIRHGGGSAAWGNAALGGTIALVSKPVSADQQALRFDAGSFDTRSATLATGAKHNRTSARVDARVFSTDGYHPLATPDRGAVDRALGSEHRLMQVRLGHDFDGMSAQLLLRHFDEDRGNGTALQNNATRIDTAVLTLRGRAATDAWQLTLYRQDLTYRSFFSAVASDRSAETPANNQYDVPSDAGGAGLTYAGERADIRFTTGLDYRQVSGETREDFLYSGGAFTRRRFAGGDQAVGGAFVSLAHDPSPTLTTLVQLRVDRWAERNGHRRESNLITGTPTRDERSPARDGTEPHGTVSLTWQPGRAWTVRGSAYTAFRLPTLNELHRPFRVGNVATEANPALTPEILRGIEAGFGYRAGRADLALTGFLNHLDDAVANVTLNATPTLVTRQRLNLDRLRVRGVEGRITYDATEELRLEAGFLHVDSRVAAAAAQPALVGLRVAQVPKTTLTARAEWQARPSLRISAQGRWTSAQFEDDENTLPLAAAGTLDFSAEQKLTDALAVTLMIGNVFDRAVPVSRSAGGLTSFASPRHVRAGVRLVF